MPHVSFRQVPTRDEKRERRERERRIRDLEQALKYQRERTEQERRRAEVAEDASRRAWQVAAWQPPRNGEKGHSER